MAIGGAVVVISVLIAACFLGPGCLGYNYLYKNQIKMKKKSAGISLVGGDFLLSEIGSSSVVTIHNINSSFRRTPVSCRQSVCSSISETSLTSGSNASYTSVGFTPLPTIVFLLQIVTQSPGKLIIFLKHLEGLPVKDFPHYSEVITELKIKSGTTYHWSAITRAIRNTRSPEYDTEFSLPGTMADLQKWCLSITAYDKDRFDGYRELATMEVFMRDFIPALRSGQVIRQASVMTVYKKEYGHLLIGLSFLPTAQRLTISLIRATNLICLQNGSVEKNFQPFARVFLLDGTGKVIQRKKVDELGIPEAARRCSFNTVITMQVTAPQMITATLLIVICYKEKNGLIPSLGMASNSSIEQISRNGYVGRVAMGNLVTGTKERKHWQMIQEKPRRVVTAWHVLK